ncbi:MAG: amino acid permease, partial [Spirochaetales bacterium]
MERSRLQSSFSPLGIWAFSIGTSIGWGSFIVTCNAYLQKAGILGTVFGLILGMAVILVITWNLQYIIRRLPNAGGIYLFEKNVGGRDLGFLAFWFILLTYLAVLWANMTSLPLFARFFLGKTFQFGFHYSIFGYEVWMGEALLSMAGITLIGILCCRSLHIPNRIVIGSALVFALGFTVCAIVSLFKHDSSYSFAPMYVENSKAFAQIIRIAVISPWAFIGFENVSHFSEEYKFPVKKIKSILIVSVLITTLLYIFVSILSISAYPPEYNSWLEYIHDMGNLEGIKAVPAFYAASHYMGQAGVVILMLSLFAVILTSLIGNMLALSRLLFAAGREGEAPNKLSILNKRGIPERAIKTVLFISIIVPFIGRTAIGWIVDVTTLGATIIYALLSYAVFKHSKNENRVLERYTGIAGTAIMVLFMLLLLIPGILPFHAVETESYILFIVWSVLGLVYFRLLIRKGNIREYGQRIIVWAILLILVIFASMMWVSRATEKAADNAVKSIFEYHETHPTDDSDPVVRAEREVFLQEQANQISKTNTLYSVFSLGLFIIVISMMLNNYWDAQKLGKRLSEAEREAEAAKKITELKDRITSLLDNMPGMTFTKDAQTGVYLACNQAFADYAHKKTPDDVVGLTDRQIFDVETTLHFIEDDKITLSMDQPYIFYEDVLDAKGNKKQFQTTKQKYVDTNGRLCILGMCRDVTDFVRIQHENAMTKEAYEQARSAGVMYSRIAQSLAHGYESVLYINLENDEFIEYRPDLGKSTLKEANRGKKFFDYCNVIADKFVYHEDREAFLKAMERQTLLNALNENNSFIMTCRLVGKNGPVYVSIRITRMKDDERFLIIGITNFDEQMKQRQMAQRVKEERIAYARLNALAGDYIGVYVVDPLTERYHEFSSTTGYEDISLAKQGFYFFETTRKAAQQNSYPDDVDLFLEAFTKENILEEVARCGIFSLTYRMMINGNPVHVKVKASMVDEESGKRLVIGLINIDEQVRQEAEYAKRLSQ